MIIASIMRLEGPTGVQAYVRAVLAASRGHAARMTFASPFQLGRILVYGTFAWGPLLRVVSTSASVWWYRVGHRLLLRRRLKQALRRSPPAVIYAQDPVSAEAALDLRREGFRLEVVLAVHFNVSEADEWAERGAIRAGGRLFRRIREREARTLERVDRLIYPSEFMREHVQRRVPGAARLPSWSIPNFVEGPSESAVESATDDLIAIGTLESRKNQEFLLRVLAECHRRGHRYRLTLVGDGPSRASLQRLVRELDLEPSVIFAGFVTDAGSLIPRYRALVHAALLENMPIALLEALAAGRPIFAGAVGGIPEIFSDGVEGRYWPLDDIERAATVLIDVLEDDARLGRLARAARARYEARFSRAQVVPRLLQAIAGTSDAGRS